MNALPAAVIVACILPAVLFAQEKRDSVRVALYDDKGSYGQGVPRVSEQLRKAQGVEVTLVKPELIQSGGLKDFDVVIFTGGSGSKQAEALTPAGVEAVRKFVDSGGGYIGICAGSYLACKGYSWGAGLIDAKTVSSKWRRGRGTVQLEMTEKGQKILGFEKMAEVRYVNGPIIKGAGDDALPDFEPIAFFRSELAENDTPKGVMVDSPAIVVGSFGKGRVLCSSPHPEQTDGMEGFIERAVRWVAGKQN